MTWKKISTLHFSLIGLLLSIYGYAQPRMVKPDYHFDQSKQAMIFEFEMPKVKFFQKFKYRPFYVNNKAKDTLAIPIDSLLLSGDTDWQFNRKKLMIEWDILRDTFKDVSNMSFYLEEKMGRPELPEISSIHVFGSQSAPIGTKIILPRKGSFLSIPTLSDNISVYISAHTGFLTPSFQDTVLYSGNILNYNKAGVYELNPIPKRKLASYSFSIGWIIQIDKKLFINAGVAYSNEKVFWKFDEYNQDYQYTGSFWAIHIDSFTREDLGGELGLLWLYKKYFLSVGYKSLAFKPNQFTIGLGLLLNQNNNLKN